MIKASGGSRAESLSFGELFQRIASRTLIIYIVFVALTLAGVLYLLHSNEVSYGTPKFEPLLAFAYFEEEWYTTLFTTFALYFLKFSPIYVVGYYLIYLKQNNWKWEYLWLHWSQVTAIFILFLCVNGLIETISGFIREILLGTLIQVIENTMIVLIISVVVSVLISIVYYGILGYLAYFAIFTESDEDLDEKSTLTMNTQDILDQ